MTTSVSSDFEKKIKKFMELFIRLTLEEVSVEKSSDDLCQRTISHITRMICFELNKFRSDSRFKFICFATMFPLETKSSVFLKRSTLTDTPIGIEYSAEFSNGKYKCFVWLIGISY